ncbi:MAG TPA: PDZ domain-containing protein, partial [Vicinamibacterales bacterium]
LGFIGMAVDESTAEVLPGLRLPFGVVVVVRVETSHTPELSLARGDVIHAVNGSAVTTPAELRDTLARVEPGDALVLQVERQGALTYLVADTD